MARSLLPRRYLDFCDIAARPVKWAFSSPDRLIRNEVTLLRIGDRARPPSQHSGQFQAYPKDRPAITRHSPVCFGPFSIGRETTRCRSGETDRASWRGTAALEPAGGCRPWSCGIKVGRNERLVRFRTIQILPKDQPPNLRHGANGASPYWLTMWIVSRRKRCSAFVPLAGRQPGFNLRRPKPAGPPWEGKVNE
jgi:hypothetical protein